MSTKQMCNIFFTVTKIYLDIPMTLHKCYHCQALVIIATIHYLNVELRKSPSNSHRKYL